MQQLSRDEVKRYARHLSLSAIGGVAFQHVLRNASVLIVGAGGLGCPCALYLAAAGVGHVGLADFDVVDISNLHRQIGHREASAGTSKVESLRQSMQAINHECMTTLLPEGVQVNNALGMVAAFDVVVDCSDNPATRYLVNDACVLAGKPLVSAASVGTEGQLSIYHFNDGPCYRCMFPEPPPPAGVMSCSEAGVLGVVPGIMGSLQALEVQKVLLVKALQNPDRYPAEIRDILSNHVDVGSIQPCVGKMLVFSALDLQFRKVTLRPRLKACAVCGESPAIRDVLSTQYGVQRELCEAPRPVLPTIPEEASVDATVLRSLPSSACLVDVRSPLQFAGVHLPSAINVPYSNLMRKDDKSIETLRSLAARYDKLFVMCRRGNDSVRTVALCFELGISNVVNIRGGLAAYAAACDPTMPVI